MRLIVLPQENMFYYIFQTPIRVENTTSSNINALRELQVVWEWIKQN